VSEAADLRRGDGPAPPPPPPPRRAVAWRILLLAALVGSWLVSIPYMWKSVTTVPSAERLQAMSSRIMHVPTPVTFLRTTGQSFVELALVGLLVWPWWRRFWLARLVVAFLGLAVWAVVTVPLELTDLEWVHHRWLVGADALLLVALAVSVVAAFVGMMRRLRGGRASRT